MTKSSKRVVLTIRPKEYLKQGLTHCGAFSTKAILDAFGKGDKKDPRDYHTFWLGKKLGMGGSISYWPSVIKSYGLNATPKYASQLPEEKRLQVIKDLLDNNYPVMVSIANGYSDDGRYSKLKAFYMQHWITVWGYDDDKQVGNTKRTYQQMLRDWKGAMLWTKISPLRFILGQLGEYHYIQVSNQ